VILAILGTALAANAGAGGARRLPRIVSINPCVDAVLVRVANPAQIAAISHYSQDPRATSIPLAVAMRFKAISGTAEEVVGLSPDLVIAGAHVEPSTIAALRRLGIKLVQLPVPVTIAESNAQIRTIAQAAGQRPRGDRLVAQIDTAVRAAAPPVGTSAIPALIWQGGGLVPGRSTLSDDVLRVTGYRNLSASYGLKQWDVLPLEYLVARPPRVLLSVGAVNPNDRLLGHPVLGQLKARMAIRAYPERLMQCGGPMVIEAVQRLAAVRRSL
jgi:iron complex transport system substrate-binding protein